MDQLGSHISPSEASRSEGCSETRSAVELEALEHLVFECCSETQSERNERQAGEGIGISSPKTIQAENEDDDESNSKEDSNEDDEEESKQSRVAEVKSAKSSAGRPEGRGVDG